MINQSNDNPSQFLNQVFYDHATKNDKNKQRLGQNDWVSNNLLLDKGGFGYLAAHVDRNSRTKLSISAQQSQYNQRNLEWIQPRKGTGRVVQQVRAGNPFILVYNLPVQKFPTSITLPQPKVSQME